MTKQRLSTSLDPELVSAAETAVREGRARSVSAWVGEALRRHIEHERRLAALDEFVKSFEAVHGEITDAEIEEVTRSVRASAIVIRPKPAARRKAS